jgi:large conductance mechanosensitive channel
MLKTLQGFKDFVMRGNVIDLSVGIVIGAAFAALVTSFTSSFVEPLIKVFGGGGEFGGSFKINGVDFVWSNFANGLVTFLITAAVLYFLVVMPMNRLAERRRKGVEPEPKKPSEEILLLQEIRDALVAGAAVPSPRPAPATSATSVRKARR